MDQKELAAGTTLQNGKYTIESVLGSGGFGITYKALQSPLNIPVAIKELFLSSSESYCTRQGQTVVPQINTEKFEKFKERFHDEAKTLTRFIGLDGIIQVKDIFEENDTVYMVMNYVAGKTIARHVADYGAISPDKAIDIISNVLMILKQVHAQNILHRDINPNNIMVNEHGKPVLLDFGIAREYDDTITLTVTAFHTKNYSAPEQTLERNRWGAYTDLYSVGATLYFMVTGKKPQAIEEITIDGYTEASAVNPAISAGLNSIINKAIKKPPGERYQSAQEFLTALEALSAPAPKAEEDKKRRLTQPLKTPPAAKPVEKKPVVPKPEKPKKERTPINTKKLVKIGGIVLAVLVLSIGGYFIVNAMGGSSADNSGKTDNAVLIKDHPQVLFPVINYTKNKLGYIDNKGNVVIDFVYDPVFNDIEFGRYFYTIYGKTPPQGEIFVRRSGNDYGPVNVMFNNGAVVSLNNKWCLLDSTGNLINETGYDNLTSFHNGMAAFKRGDKWGYINNKGEEIIAPKYDQANNFSAGIASVKLKSTWMYINKKGEKAFSYTWEDEFTSQKNILFSDGLCGIVQNQRVGYINTTGSMVIAPTVEIGHDFCEGYAIIGEVGYDENSGPEGVIKYGIMDANGKIIVKPNLYNTIDDFSHGMAAAERLGKWGYINTNGKEVVFKYQSTYPFSDYYGLVERDDKYGYVDGSGNEVIKPTYKYAHSFSDGLASVMNDDDKYGYIDKQGNLVLPYTYDEAFPFYNGLALIKKGDKYGYINKEGKEFFY